MFRKRLKRISREVIGYLRIRGANARDADELTMVVSYGYSKLEQCEWYMDLLRREDRKYMVPQSLDELKSIRDEIQQTLDNLTEKPYFRIRGSVRNRYDNDLEQSC